MTKHEWRDRAKDGEQVFYRAQHFAGRWEFFFTRKSDPEWEQKEMLSLEEMEAFREVLWNKHLRRRAPLKHVDQIDKMIEELRTQQAEVEESPEG
jgi:thymidylate synthase